mgnify:FL=1
MSDLLRKHWESKNQERDVLTSEILTEAVTKLRKLGWSFESQGKIVRFFSRVVEDFEINQMLNFQERTEAQRKKFDETELVSAKQGQDLMDEYFYGANKK